MADSNVVQVQNGFRPPEPLSLTGNLADNYKKFLKRFNVYMKATGNIKREKDIQASMFLNLIGEDAHEVFDTLGLDAKEAEDLDAIMAAFEKYCMPRKNVVYDRHAFYIRNKQPGETFDHFLTEIKKLIKPCEFSEGDSMLRDRIVLGIGDDILQERLLRVPNLTLDKAIEYCQAAELSHRQMQVLHGEPKVETLNRISVSKNKIGDTSNCRQDRANEITDCNKCGYKHSKNQCMAFNKVCYRCNQRGHFAKGCFKNRCRNNWTKQENVRKTAGLVTQNSGDSDNSESFVLYSLNEGNINKSWYQTVIINDVPIEFKLDTGADINVLPVSVYLSIKTPGQGTITGKSLKLVTYGGKPIRPLGLIDLECSVNQKIITLQFAVADVVDKPLLSLSTCQKLGLIKRINLVTESPLVDKKAFIQNNHDVFKGIGCYKIPQKIVLKDNSVPCVKPPYRVAESLKNRLHETLEMYESKGFISKVDVPTDWVHNLIIVEKPNGSIRLCLDPKEINKVVKREHFYIPTGDELSPGLANKQLYTVLDMKDGFFQLKLDDASSKLCTFHTPFGRFKFNRMPFGLASAPEIFQKIITQVFGDIEGVLVYFDDIIISANNVQEHDLIVNKVLSRARNYNIKFNPDKLQYRVSEVKYLGQIFSKEGIKPDPGHVQAIKNLKDPTNKKEVQGVLGMINFVGKFVPRLSQVTAPLRELLKKDVVWHWTDRHHSAIQLLKERISSAPVLKCFDPNRKLTIQADSSKDGLGCCLLMGKDPISFASRSLTDTEKNYAQIEKELLSICFATQKFHTFIYGRQVTVNTDHKPLEALLSKDINKISSRLQRMYLKLIKYDLVIEYLPGKLMYVADLLSRNFSVTKIKDDPEMLEKVHSIERGLPVTDEKLLELQKATDADSQLSIIKKYLYNGWPSRYSSIPKEVKWAWKLKDKLQLKQELLLLENRIVIPKKLQKDMLNLLHESHLGIVKCKKKARQVMFWTGMSTDIELMITKCKICEKFSIANTKEPLIQFKIPDFPFEVIGVDICMYAGQDYLITSCYLTKWIEITELKYKTADEVIGKLKTIFATHGIPLTIVSDNMPFSSHQFRKFTKEWQIQPALVSPRHPQANGLAERMVGVAKMILKKTKASGGDLNLSILDYRNTPLDGMSVSPAQLLMNRNLRTRLPVSMKLLKSELADLNRDDMKKNKDRQKQYFNRNTKSRKPFERGDNILVRNKDVWQPGIVRDICRTPRSYIVTKEDGSNLRRNSIMLKRSHNPPVITSSTAMDDDNQAQLYINRESPIQVPLNTSGEHQNMDSGAEAIIPKSPKDYTTRSGRTINKPIRFRDYSMTI